MTIHVTRPDVGAFLVGRRLALALCAVILAAACGGGGGSNAGPPPAQVNSPPVAVAGPAQSVVAGSTTQLDGSASSDSDGDTLTYSWTLADRPAGSVAALSGAQSARPTLATDLPGPYTLTLVVSDGKASSAPSSVTINAAAFGPAPAQWLALSLKAPEEGAFIHGQLEFSGTVANVGGPKVTITATLQDVPILQVQGPTFSLQRDIRNLAPGLYTLIVRATDSTGRTNADRRVYRVASSAARVYAPVSRLPDAAKVLAAEGSKILLRQDFSSCVPAGTCPPPGPVMLRDLATGSDVMLEGSQDIQHEQTWQLSAGQAVAVGKHTRDCPLYCAFAWDGAGRRRILGSEATSAARARDGVAVWPSGWAVNGRTLAVHDLARGRTVILPLPSGTSSIVNNGFELSVTPEGVAYVFFVATTEGSTLSNSFLWRSDTGSTVKLSTADTQVLQWQADGQQAAWIEAPQNAPATPPARRTLRLAPLASGSPVTLTSTPELMQVWLGGGVLAWAEGGLCCNINLLAWVPGSGPRTLTPRGWMILYGMDDGRVLFGERAANLSAWNVRTQSTAVLVDFAPDWAFAAGGFFMFTLGSNIYRAPLP